MNLFKTVGMLMESRKATYGATGMTAAIVTVLVTFQFVEDAEKAQAIAQLIVAAIAGISSMFIGGQAYADAHDANYTKNPPVQPENKE